MDSSSAEQPASTSRTIGNAGIYALGNILRYLTSFIMLPVYTRHLTPADYGVLELLTMVIDLAGIILGMRLGEAIYRYYNEGRTAPEKNAVMSTALLLAVVVTGTGATFLYNFAPAISHVTFGSGEHSRHVQMFSLILLLQSLAEMPLLLIRAQQRPWLFVAFSLLKLMLQVSFNIYFVVYRGLGIDGVIYSGILTSAIYTPLLIVYALYHTGFRPNAALARSLVAFSLPLALADVGAFYLTFGDRYFLRVFSSLSEIGTYALAYKFGFLLLYFTWGPFQSAWDAHKYTVHGLAEARQVYRRNFLIISFLMIFLGLCMSVFISDLLRLMSAPAFWSAANIVPVIVVAYIVQGWTFYSNFGVLITGKTSQIAYGSLVAALVITIGYFSLIPAFGAMGAACATLIAFTARLIWVHERARREYDMMLPWGKAGAMLALACVAYGISTMGPTGTILGLFWRSAVILLYLASFLWFPFLAESQKQMLLVVARNPRKLAEILG